jgi:hypothetical protein
MALMMPALSRRFVLLGDMAVSVKTKKGEPG